MYIAADRIMNIDTIIITADIGGSAIENTNPMYSPFDFDNWNTLIHFYSRFNDYVSEEFFPLSNSPYVNGAESFENLLKHKSDYEHSRVRFSYTVINPI